MENYNNIINNNEYNAMVYANIQQTAIPQQQPHQAANSEPFNLSYNNQRESIIAHNIPQSLGLYPTEQIASHQHLHLAPVQSQPTNPEQQVYISQTNPHLEVPVVPPMNPPETYQVPSVIEPEPAKINEEIPVMVENTETSQNEVVSEQTAPPEIELEKPQEQSENNIEGQEPTDESVKKEEGTTNTESQGESVEGEGDIEEDEEMKPEPKQEEPEVDPNQCRVCKSTEQLLDIFAVEYDMRICDLIMKICTNVRIHERDYLPKSICYSCVDKLKNAFDFKNTCEATDKELRQKLKRSKNKARKPSDFVLIDCNLYSGDSDNNDEENDDDFIVSDVAEEIESDDSYTEKKKSSARKRPVKRSRPRQKPKSRAPVGKTSARPSRSAVKSAPPPSSSKKPDLSSTSKRLKRDIVYIEANYDSSDDEIIGSKKKRTGKSKERKETGGANIGSTDDVRPSKHVCKECGKECTSKKTLSAHRATHFQPGEDAPFRCSICNRGFKYNINLTSHMQIHKDNYTCDCGKSFSNKSDLKKHTNTEHKNDNSITYECSKCKRFFSSLSRYEKHRESCTSVSTNHQKTIKISAPNSAKKHVSVDRRPRDDSAPPTGKDLFKTVAPLTTTYWSDSFSD